MTRRTLLALATAAVACASVLAAGGSAASSAVTVTLDVLSASELSIAGCPTSARAFGIVQPGSVAKPAASCTIGYGSSNDTSTLRVFQSDGYDRAMHGMPWGALRTAFGATGVVEEAAGAGAEFVWGAERMSDGDLLLFGWVETGGTNDDWMTMRLTADGGLDGTWNATGWRVIAPSGGYDYVNAAIELASGDVVLAGSRRNYSGACQWRVMKLDSLGATVGTWGVSSGWTDITQPGTISECDVAGIHELPDGKLVVTGNAGVSGSVPTGIDLAVARLDPDGTPDLTYGASGVQRIDVGNADDDYAYDSTLLPDGRVLLAGTTWSTSFRPVLSMVRSDGTGLDSGWGASGRRQVTVNGVGMEWVSDVEPDASGGFVAGGQAMIGGGNWQAMAMRVDAGGALVGSFGSSGVEAIGLPTGVTSSGTSALHVEPDGSLLLGGYAQDGDVDSVVYRLRGDTGALLGTLDDDGVLLQDLEGGQSDSLVELVGDRDGRVTALGRSAPGGTMGFAAFELDAVTVADYGVGGDFGAGSDAFGACLSGVGGDAVLDGTTWVVDGGGCTVANGAGWHAIPTSSGDAAALVAKGSASSTTSTASLDFGARVGAARKPGSYLAPLTFEVVAPG